MIDLLLVVVLAGMFGLAGFVLAMLASGRWPR